MERFRHILNWIFTVGMILMLIVTIGIDDNATYEAYNQASELSEGWNVIEADGSRSEGSLPYRFPDGNHLVELVYTLPALSNDDVLLVEGNYNAMYAYIDGKEIYHSLPATFGMLETDLGHYAAIIPLDDAYSGKEIVLRIQERTSGYNTDIKHIYLTTTGQYGFNKFVQNAFALALSIVLLTCAAVSFCVWLVFWKRNGGIPGESYHPLLWISLFSICLGMWISSEIYIWAIAGNCFTAFGIISYLTLSLMPVSLLGILKSICTEKLASLQYIVFGAKILLLTEWALFLLGIFDLSDILIVIQAFCIIALIIFAVYVIRLRDKFSLTNTARSVMLATLIPAALTAIAYVHGGDWLFWALGTVTMMLISVLIATFYNIYQAFNTLTETKEYKEFTMTDIMTGMKSRYAYTIFEAQYKMGALPKNLCLIYMDIDALKAANDNLGHTAGDELIIGTSKCIRTAFGKDAECFRMGGDEFLVALMESPDEIQSRIAHFDRLISRWEGKYTKKLSVSYGVAAAWTYPEMDFDDLLRTADKKMYQHKKNYSAYS